MQDAAETGFGEGAQVLLRFAAALGLGVLLGLERERKKPEEETFAGVRTFGLFALLGALSGWAGDALGLPWVAPACFAAIALLVLASYVISAQKGDIGVTTEVGALITFLLGLACERDQVRLATSVAIAVLLVLVLKDWLHGIAQRIQTEDVTATLQFLIVTLIVLPLVPDQTWGEPPFDVLNPYRIWLMVVLISAVDFGSWLLVKLVGGEHGIQLTGLLGGLASSTATTLSFTKRSRQEPALSRALALGILIAWLVMFARVAVFVSVSSSSLLAELWPALAAMAALNVAAVAWLWLGQGKGKGRGTTEAGANPFRLSNALRFGLLFGVILFVARAAEVWLGSQGLLIAGALAGLTDVDAITLSMSQFAQREGEAPLAADALTLGIVANTLVKGGMASFAGAPGLRTLLLPIALAIAAAGVVLAFVL